MNIGICYYPEQCHESRWDTDSQLFRDAGITIARMAEFAWAKMEPRPGEFEFAWLDRAIETFAKHGFRIVLGTPTAAPPPWLSRAHPDSLPVDEFGRRKNPGARRHYCPNSVTYRQYTERIVRAMAERYAADERVTGWQIDNEFGEGNTARCYCENCATAFRAWLENKYQTLDALNDAWGGVFWSQTYHAWSELGAPVLLGAHPPNPSHALDYFRFASDAMCDYQQLQISILVETLQQMLVWHSQTITRRNACTAEQFITHNFMGLFSDINYFKLAEPLSFVSWDSYPTGHAEHGQSVLADADNAVYSQDAGAPLLTQMMHDSIRGHKNGAPFWVMEQQAGYVNWGEYNPAPRPGILHLWLWQNFAAGADTTVIFRDRAVDLAQEQYHSGLLNHNHSFAQGYTDLVAFKEQRALMQSLQDTRVQNDAAFVFSYDDSWALQLQPHRKDFSYRNLVFTYYAALLRAGVPCDIVSRDADLSRYKLVLAPSLHLADQALAARLLEYVEGGGTLALGIRSGFKTMTNRVTTDSLPGALRGLVGARVTSWQSLPPNVTQPVALMWRGWQTVSAARWVETLEIETAGAIAQYTGGPLDGQTAMTANVAGNGLVFYVGWMPDQPQADALVGMLTAKAGVQPVGMLPPGVVAGRRVRENESFLVLMNFTDAEKRAWLNGTGWRDAFTQATIENEVSIPARGTRVVCLSR